MEARAESNLARCYQINISYLNPVEPSSLIVLKLYPHQKEALGWLINRENREVLPPLWEQRHGFYINVMDKNVQDVQPKLPGGIFFDATGLGKTLCLISLICHDVSADISGNTNRTVGKECRKTTLVVCCSSISDWILQIQKSTRKGSLNVYQYEEADKLDSFDEYSVVLATYEDISKPGCPLKRNRWWRVILDDADHFSDMREEVTKPFIELRAGRRWLVSGKPIDNGEHRLLSFIRFLGIEPLASKSNWLKWLDIPGERTRKPCDQGLSHLQAIVASIGLRREKNVLQLPPKIIHDYLVDLTPEERERHDYLQFEVNTHQLDSEAYIRLSYKLRETCSDSSCFPSSLMQGRPSKCVKDVSKKPELEKKMLEVEECVICSSSTAKMVITSCEHSFCLKCIWKWLVLKGKSTCPMCRTPVSNIHDLYSYVEDERVSSTTPSTKAKVLLSYLLSTRTQNPSIGGKSVVFSQFKTSLQNLSLVLREAGFQTLSLFKNTSPSRKRMAILEFFAAVGEDAPTVLLANLKTDEENINLTAACMGYFLEPFVSSAAEQRAVSSLHQIGQREEIRLVRLIARDTVESS